MNFGKKGIIKQKEDLHATAPKVSKRFNVSLLQVILFLLILVIVCGGCMGLGAYNGIIDDAPDITDANIMPLGYASFVYDQNGTEIQKLSSVEGNRISLDISEIPLNMQHAIVAIEDSRFYEHNGVDPHGMIRAVVVALSSNFNRSEGASTITQQLLKNNVFTGWTNETRIRRLTRKIQEQYLAVQLEQSLHDSGQDPKQVILENYLNTVNFGSGAYGVQTAALTYFGKDASKLTLSECAVLAAIPQNPSSFNPKIYPEENALRMKTVLDYMLEQGYVTQDEYTEALNDDVYSRIRDYNEVSSQEREVYSYFVDKVIEQVQNDLMTQKGYTAAQANNLIYSGGIQIFSTESPEIQAIMEDELANEANYPPNTEVSLEWALSVSGADGEITNYSREMLQNWYRENGDEEFDLYFSSEAEAQTAIDKYKAAVVGAGDEVIAERTDFVPEPQACMTVIDQSTGYVVGIVGGRGEKVGSLTLNRATDSLRQPGSALSPLSSFGPALDLNDTSLAAKIDTKDIDAGDVSTDSSMSAEQIAQIRAQKAGTMTVREAITNTMNAAAYRLLQDVSSDSGYEYLKRLGISTLDGSPRTDISLNLAVGSLTNGVNNLDMTAAYAAIANGGVYNSPIFYTKVTDHEGNIILENTSTSRQVFKDSTAWLMTDALRDVVSKGTGTAFQLPSGLSVAGTVGLTGTNIDKMFIGYTPYYTAGIWAGYDTGLTLPEGGDDYISTIWTKVMDRIHQGMDQKDFAMPASVELLTVCADSGKLAGNGCKTVTDYFDVGAAPRVICVEHVPTPTPTPKVTAAPSTTPAEGEQSSEENGDQQDTDEQPETPEQPDNGDNAGEEPAGSGEESYE
ncbi:MAG: transglycosylase domain-containing protein [Eubacteriales bacterium]|nr:transglycosylase domain-containing protein [Eubacteriales bacterium]